MNINDLSQLRPCTSCQMCGAVCPVAAITIQLNENGFYRPVVDDRKCIDCGLCVKSCYKFDDEIKITSDLGTKEIYAAWAKDNKTVESTTSGGIADLLARELIAQGYKCIGVIYDSEKTVQLVRLRHLMMILYNSEDRNTYSHCRLMHLRLL